MNDLKIKLNEKKYLALVRGPATPTAPTQVVRKKDAQASRGLLCLVTPELVKPRLDDSGRVAAPESPLRPSAATPTITPPPVAPGYLVTPTRPLYQPMPFAADTPAQLRDLVFRHTSPFHPQPRGQGVPPDWHSPAFVPELFDHIGGWHPLSEVSPSLGQGHPSSPAARPLVPIPGRLEHAGAWDLPRPSIERTRLDELRAALTHLEAAGLKENAEQVRREIKLEERAAARRELDQKERDLETAR